jgi:hypothetical protein
MGVRGNAATDIAGTIRCLLARTVSLEADDAVVAVELHSDGTLRANGQASWRRLRPR